MKQTIVFATGNAHKLQEINEIAQGSDIEFILPPEGFNPIEDGKTFEENSLIKAREAAHVSGIMSLADDSGLCVEALGGAPGIHSARYAQTAQARIDKLLNVLKDKKNRKAKFVCAMTLVNKDGDILFQTRGECYGEIAYLQSGANGFGYDPIFLVEEGKNGSAATDGDIISHTGIDTEGKKTMADMSEQEKNEISHRGRALRKVLEYLNNN